MPEREGAAGGAVDVHHGAEGLGEGSEGVGRSGPEASAGEHHRTLGPQEQLGDSLDDCFLDSERLAVPVALGPLDGILRHHVGLNVERNIEEHRPAPAGKCMPGGGGDVVGQPTGLPGGFRPAGDRTNQLGVVHLLEPAPLLLADEVASTEQQHRGPGELGGGQGRDGVGDAGPGGDGGHTEATGQPGVGLGGVGGGLLVTNIDDPDALLHAPVEDGHDVPTGEREDGVDALGLERPGNDLSAVNASHSPKPTGRGSGLARRRPAIPGQRPPLPRRRRQR